MLPNEIIRDNKFYSWFKIENIYMRLKLNPMYIIYSKCLMLNDCSDFFFLQTNYFFPLQISYINLLCAGFFFKWKLGNLLLLVKEK